MANFPVEQALYRRSRGQPPRLVAKSPGFDSAWEADAERLAAGFGEPTPGVVCPLAIFACPLNDRHIAVVRVADQAPNATPWPFLAFHFLFMERAPYERLLGDPFAVAEQFPAPWSAQGELPSLTVAGAPLRPRTVADVQAVLKRVKAYALREDEDPEAAVMRTVENSESPALLGGVQVLVDGGKLVFVRSAPDQALVQGLWTLLPDALRGKLWPATFAFSNELAFDVIVVPSQGAAAWEGYTTEDQAADYPAGSYEFAVQLAAESGSQGELDAVFAKRSSGETMKLAWTLLVVMCVLVIGGRMFLTGPEPPRFPVYKRAALAAGIVAIGDPWSASALVQAGNELVQGNRMPP
jgi:hypothetical protein